MTDTERLRQFAHERNLTQERLAEQLGLAREHVNRVMSGARPITTGFIGAFARVYGFEAAAEIFTDRQEITA